MHDGIYHSTLGYICENASIVSDRDVTTSCRVLATLLKTRACFGGRSGRVGGRSLVAHPWSVGLKRKPAPCISTSTFTTDRPCLLGIIESYGSYPSDICYCYSAAADVPCDTKGRRAATFDSADAASTVSYALVEESLGSVFPYIVYR